MKGVEYNGCPAYFRQAPPEHLTISDVPNAIEPNTPYVRASS